MVEKLASRRTRVVHACDREGDITEVFAQCQLQHTGVIVRAVHNRSEEFRERANDGQSFQHNLPVLNKKSNYPRRVSVLPAKPS